MRKYNIYMDSDLIINTNPSIADLKDIEKWLIEEYNELGDGFYSNWNVICNAFKNGLLVTLEYLKSPIGFITFNNAFDWEIHINEDVFVIKPKYRGRGIGKIFSDKISEFYLQKGAFMITGFSVNDSLGFWENMGWKRYYTSYNSTRLDIYKPLVDIASISNNSDFNNRLELWNLEPYQINDTKPMWVWDIKTENNKLVLPIIHPCRPDWNLRWVKNNIVIREDKIKYFDKEVYKYYKSPFLYISELIE